jgi:hypothetical protein
MFFAGVAFVFGGLNACFAQGFSADDIIKKVYKAYSEAENYVDKGQVTTVYINKGKQVTDIKMFSTYFIRPDRFKFELKYKTDVQNSNWGKYVVMQDGGDPVPGHPESGKSETPEPLSMAIAGAESISGGSAFYILSLLLSYDVGGSKITDLQDMKVVDLRDNSFQIRGVRSGSRVTLWIDATSFLIKRVEMRTGSPGSESAVSIQYNPRVNVKIQDKDILPQESEGQAET